MNKLFTKIATAFVGIAMAVGVGVAVGSNAKEAIPVHAASDTLAMSAVSSSDSNISAVAAKSNGQNAPIPATVNSNDGVRMYANNTLTISSSQNITSLTIPWYKNGSKTFASVSIQSGGGTYTHASSSGNSGTWTGSSKEIVLKVGSSGQIQLYQIQYVTAAAKTLSSISLGGTYETSFNQNATFNHTGMTVTANYSDGTSADVTSSASWSSPDMTTAGNKTVTVSYTESGTKKTQDYSITVVAHTHTWVAGTVHAATCTEDGYTEYSCSGCDETKHDDIVAALGHDYGEWIIDTAATCTTNGAKHRVCSHDNSHVENAVIEATGHNYVNHVCTVCGAEEPNETTIAKTMSEIVSENEYTVSQGSNVTCYTEFSLDAVVTISTTGSANCGSFWGTSPNHEWRLYQNKDGNIIITVSTGYELSSVTITYGVSNTGALFDGESSQITSGTAYSVSGSSVTYTVGNTGSATNGQAKVTAISVTYTGGSTPTPSTLSVTYNGNDATSGDVPTDDNEYDSGDEVTVLGNTGNLAKTNCTFSGWNTQPDGQGTTYSAGNTFEITSNVTLYAKWTVNQEGTGTINFGSASGSTNINSASVEGNDSFTNTWTVTTEGTSSFTPNAGYSQIGSSSSPATSITFTTTLPASKTVSAFSAKFGGFSGTAGTVTLEVGSTTVGTGSLNAGNDVTVVNSTQAVGTVLTVTVTSISKGVKAYYISYTLTSDAPVVTTYTVTYDGNGSDGGTTPVDSTSYSYGDTVTVLENSFTKTGYTFVHWNTAQDGSGSSYEKDEQFTISTNTTLYAIWEESGGGGSTTAARCYRLVTSTADLVAGAKYIITNDVETGTGFFALGSQKTSNRDAEPVTSEKTGVAQVSSSAVEVITLGGSTGAWTLGVTDGYLYAAGSDKNYLKTRTENSDANSEWAISFSEGVASIVAQGSNRSVMQYNYNGGEEKALFSCYATASQSDVYLYRLDFGETLLANIDCGTGTGSHTMPEGYTWNTDLQGVYNDLPEGEKASLASASSAGLERYDYIVGKYNPTGEKDSSKTNYVHFITGRTVTPRSSSGIVLLTVLGKNTTNTSIIVIVTVGIAAIAIGGYFLLRKKKED